MFILPPAAWQPPIRLIKPRCWLSPLSCIFSLDIQFHDLTEGKNGNFMQRVWRLPESSLATSSKQAPVEGAGQQHGPTTSVLPLVLQLELC